MIKPWELFKKIKKADYIHTGLSADFSVSLYKKEIYVMFEKSDGSIDWINNILFIPVFVALPFIWPVSLFCKKYRGLAKYWNVHLGIALVWLSMKGMVLNTVRDLHKDHLDYRIVVCGWSHGGGHSQLCAREIYKELGTKPLLMTFGSLRVFFGKKGKNSLLKSVDQESMQFENGSDIVPSLPGRLLGYRLPNRVHIGEPFNIFNIVSTAKYHCDYGNEQLY